LCGTRILDGVFAICREAERKHFSKCLGMHSPEVEVTGLKSIAKYCSSRCRRKGRKIAMSAERVPLPATRPSVGPIEVCAKCGGIVDMTKWHLVYLQSNDNTPTYTSNTYDARELAVLCRTCAPI
jgi:hypothetical protein